jgi:hypothetical protein
MEEISAQNETYEAAGILPFTQRGNKIYVLMSLKTGKLKTEWYDFGGSKYDEEKKSQETAQRHCLKKTALDIRLMDTPINYIAIKNSIYNIRTNQYDDNQKYILYFAPFQYNQALGIEQNYQDYIKEEELLTESYNFELADLNGIYKYPHKKINGNFINRSLQDSFKELKKEYPDRIVFYEKLKEIYQKTYQKNILNPLEF